MYPRSGAVHIVMRLLQLIETALGISGEWWCDPHGHLTFADGDVGDYNHAAVVLEEIVNLWCGILGVDNELGYGYTDFRIGLADGVDGPFGSAIEALAENAGVDPYDFEVYDYIKNKLMEDGRSRQEVDAMSDVLNDRLDPREFCIGFWGWIRIAGNNAELPNLSRAVLKRAGGAFLDILFEDGEEPTDEDLLDTMVNVSTYTGSRYEVSISDLCDGRLEGEDADAKELAKRATSAVRAMDVKAQHPYYGSDMGG